MTLQQIAEHYILNYRDAMQEELNFYRDQQNAQSAIRVAAQCIKRENGRELRHSHQRRIPKSVLNSAELKLQASAAKLARSKDFSDLHETIYSLIFNIKGVGELTVYDIAHRLGIYWGKEPTQVYLHAGARIGAKALGFSGETLNPAELPEAFSRLSPSEIEDCLCMYKNDLLGNAQPNRDLTCTPKGKRFFVRPRRRC